MKNKKQLLQFVAILFLSLGTYAQVTVNVSSLQYTNNGQPTFTLANCGNINLASSTSTSINLGINLSKPHGQVVGSSELRVFTQKSGSAIRIERSFTQIIESSWNTFVQPNARSMSASFNINSSDFNASGGTLFVVFKSSGNIQYTSTCIYTITKALLPSFTLSPTSLVLACGDTAAKTFTVLASNVPNGAISNHGWSYTGWSEISRTSNSITLSPPSNPALAGNVTVFPSVNGITYQSKTCTVTRAPFTNNGTISGLNYFCTSATFCASVAGATTYAWSVTSGANRVTLSSNGSSCVTLTALPNASGEVSLSVTAGDSCGRTITLGKIINVKTNIIYTGLVAGSTGVLFNETVNYSYSGAALSDPNASYTWFIYGGVNDGLYGPTGPDGGAYIVSGQGTSSIQLETGSLESILGVEVTATTSTACNLVDTGLLWVNVSNQLARKSSLKSVSSVSVFPNPFTNSSTLQVNLNTKQQNDLGKYTTKYFVKTIDNQVKIYDFSGNLEHAANYQSNQMSLNNLNLKQGKYILNVTTNTGEMLKTILFVR